MIGIQYIYESIGSTYGLHSGLWWFIGGSAATICVKENNLALWGTECDYYFTNIKEESPSDIFIYPNPFTSSFQISNLEFGNIVQIFDGTRRLIKEVFYQNQDVFVDASNFSSGVYYITVFRNNSEPLHKTIIKN